MYRCSFICSEFAGWCMIHPLQHWRLACMLCICACIHISRSIAACGAQCGPARAGVEGALTYLAGLLCTCVYVHLCISVCLTLHVVFSVALLRAGV